MDDSAQYRPLSPWPLVWRIVGLLVMIPAAAYGAHLLAGHGQDDRGQWWHRGHLQVIQGQLAGLKTHLERYRHAHGRYPTNDEGLAALDNFQARFTIELTRDAYAPPDDLQVLSTLGYGRAWPKYLTEAVRRFRQDNGRLPRDIRELDPTIASATRAAPTADVVPLRFEIAIGIDDTVYVLSPTGVLSPWLLPYVYENRAGLDPAKLADSPANADRRRQFSVRVDEQIYVYCMGGQVHAEELNAMRREDTRLRLTGAAFLLGAIVLVVFIGRNRLRLVPMDVEGASLPCYRMVRRLRAFFPIGLVGLVLSAIAGYAVTTIAYVSCYVMSPMFSRRDPQMVVQQRELLDRYRARGVISDATYQKAFAATEPWAATSAPASRPSGER